MDTPTSTGVFSQSDLSPLRLDGCSIAITLQTCAASISLKQEYKNTSLKPKTVFYSLLLPENWHVSSTSVQIDKNQQSSTLGVRPTPSGGEYTDHLKLFIPWSVPPGHTVVVGVNFLVPLWSLSADKLDTMNLTLPSFLLPDANPASSVISEWQSHFTLEYANTLPHGYLISIEGTLLRNITGTKAEGGGKMKIIKNAVSNGVVDIKLEDRTAEIIPRDVAFSFTLDTNGNNDVLQSHVVKDPHTKFGDDAWSISLGVTPYLDASKRMINSEVIFVVDCSGSMVDHLTDVKRAISLALHALPSTVYYNIIAFGNTVTWFKESGSVPRTNDIGEVNEFISKLKANMGTTELFKALQHVYKTPVIEGYSRQLVIITDGREEKFQGKVVQLAVSNTHHTRIHAVGIHPYIDVAFLTEMTKCTGGSLETITAPEDTLAAIVKMYSSILRPAFTQLNVAFYIEGSDDVFPIRPARDNIPLVFTNSRSVLSFFSPQLPENVLVVLTALVNNSRVEFKTIVAKPSAVTATAKTITHQYTALQRIFYLTELQSKTACSREENDEVVRLSVGYSIQAPITGFQMKDVTVCSSSRSLLPNRPWERSAICGPTKRDGGDRIVPADIVEPTKLVTPKTNNTDMCQAIVLKSILQRVCGMACLDDLLYLQAADGTWPLSESFAHCCDLSLQLIKANTPAGVESKMWATALALVLMRGVWGEKEKEFRFFAQNGYDALANGLQSKVESLSKDATAFLQKYRGLK